MRGKRIVRGSSGCRCPKSRLLHGETSGVLFDRALANAFYFGQILRRAEWAVGFAVGHNGFRFALANAAQFGQGGHIGGVDVDRGGLRVGKAGQQAEQQYESSE